MNEVTTIGVDLAKNVFQVHGVDASGEVVIRKQLRRRQVMPFLGKLTKIMPLDGCKGIKFPWRSEIGTIFTILDVIWGMLVERVGANRRSMIRIMAR